MLLVYFLDIYNGMKITLCWLFRWWKH